MSLPGAVDGRPRPRSADAADRGHVVRAGRGAPAPSRRTRAARAVRRWRHGRFLAVLLAVALGAGGALALLVVTLPGALASATGEEPAAARSAGPPPAREVVLPAEVIAGSSCTAADPHDVVALSLEGARHDVALDGCGAIVGSATTVRVLVAPDATGLHTPRGTARVLGTGGSTPLVDPAASDTAATTSPMAGRITVTLTVLAGIAMAGLLVALGREGMRSRPATPAGAARPARAAGGAPGAVPRPAGTADPSAPPSPRAVTTTAAPGGPRARSRARSLRAPHPARSARADGRPGAGAERLRRGPGERARTRRPR